MIEAAAIPRGAISSGRGRAETIWPVIMVLATFGPYLSQTYGFRTEQVVLYPLAAVSLLGIILRGRVAHAVMPLFLVWSLLVAVALIAASHPSSIAGSFFAGLDNLLGPLAALLIVSGWLLGAFLHRPSRLVEIVARTFVVLMSLNAVLAVISSLVPLDRVLRYFWSASGNSVAIRAAGSGRYSGVFNQPVEAGAAYSLALLCAIYLYAGKKRDTRKLALAGLLLCIGGTLTVSKLFLIGGLPIALVQIVLIARKRASLAAASAVLLIATWFTVDTYLPDYQHTHIFDLLLFRSSDSGGILGLVTSGRLGTTPRLASPVGYVMDHSAVSGFGPSGIRLAYDSAWVEALAVAGLIGVGLLCLLFLTLGAQWFARRQRMLTPERRLTAGLIALLAFGSIGGPVFTMNRFASIAWIMLPALFTSVNAAKPNIDWPETIVGSADRRAEGGGSRDVGEPAGRLRAGYLLGAHPPPGRHVRRLYPSQLRGKG